MWSVSLRCPELAEGPNLWSVVCVVSDKGTRYTLVKGDVPEADFKGSRRQCLAYIRRMSGE